jgi:hypothetical protein
MSNKKDAGGSDAGASDANMMLIEACEDGDLRKAKIALKKNADVNFANPAKKNRTPLMEACMSLNEELVKCLLANKADINKEDADGWNSLHWITFKGHAKTLILLLEKGGNWRSKSKNGSLPIDVALGLTSQKKVRCAEVLKQWDEQNGKRKTKKQAKPEESRWGYHYNPPMDRTGRTSYDRTSGWDDEWDKKKQDEKLNKSKSKKKI